jgi:hypothetical protein
MSTLWYNIYIFKQQELLNNYLKIGGVIMGRKKKGFTIKISSKDIKVRSPFANMPISGCGPHKSVKDYNRQASKLETKKLSQNYE